jgi:predicted HicB family RNase H-like nuclease
MKKMTARLSDEVHAKLKILSALEGKSMLQIITECIEDRFAALGKEASKLLKKNVSRRPRG